MKKLKFVIAFFTACILASCLDSEEKIVINADDSGSYSLTLDMGKMIAMAAEMGKKSEHPEKRDTTIAFKNFVDTATDLSAEEKTIFRDATFTMNLDEANNEMKMIVYCPFKKTSDLAYVKNNLMVVANKLHIMDKATGDKAKDKEDAASKDKDSKAVSEAGNPLSDFYKYTVTPGKISNTITDKDALNAMIAGDSTLDMMKKMTVYTGEFTYKTIYVLPKPAKKFTGSNAAASANNKTITFTKTFTEMMEKPSDTEYTIEY